MKHHLDNIGYATVAIAMLVLGIGAIVEHANTDFATPVFELERVTIVASRDEVVQARRPLVLARAGAAAVEPAAPVAQ